MEEELLAVEPELREECNEMENEITQQSTSNTVKAAAEWEGLDGYSIVLGQSGATRSAGSNLSAEACWQLSSQVGATPTSIDGSWRSCNRSCAALRH